MRVLITALSLLVATSALAAPRWASPVGETVPSVVVPVQADQSFRVNELEELIRQLNGRIEELTFQILETQENLRRQQEDYELRFQELEDRQGSAPSDGSTAVAENESGVSDRLGKPETTLEADASGDALADTDVSDRSVAEVSPDAETNGDDLASRDLEPRALGTLIFDAEGNVVDAAPADDAGRVLDGLDSTSADAAPEAVDAAIFGASPEDVLLVSQEAVTNRDYPRAEQAARAALQAWPESAVAGETKAALGEALFWQKRYYDAAQVQLDAHRTAPEADTAADNLLGLGLSLAGLNQREVACATYAEVLNQYPDAAPRLAPRLRDEQAAARCI